MRACRPFAVCAATVALVLSCQVSFGSSGRVFDRQRGRRLASGFTFTTVDPPGSVSTFLFGINLLGDIVGQYTDAGGVARGFVLSGGVFHVLRIQGLPGLRPRGINSRREIVGVYPGGHGFLMSQGRFTTIDFPGAARTAPRGINEAGDVTGDFSLPDGVVHGFLRTGAGYSQIDFPGACATLPNAINTAGDVVGDYGVGTCDGTEEHHGFLLRNGVFTTADDPNGVYQYVTVPYGTNDLGIVVGTYSGRDRTHGFLSWGGTYVDVDSPDAADVTRCFGISLQGWIVGDYFDASGVRHGFLARP